MTTIALRIDVHLSRQAYDKTMQKVFSEFNLPFSIKWEVARRGKENYDAFQLRAYAMMNDADACKNYEQEKSGLLSEKEQSAIVSTSLTYIDFFSNADPNSRLGWNLTPKNLPL
jgi:hypothetical protein